MKAAIIAGGKGTRLQHQYTVPKPLVPVGGKPVLQYQLELLSRFQITEVVLLLGHGSEQIMDFCGDGSRWGLHIEYSIEPEPLGTAGAVRYAAAHFSDDFLVMHADLVINMDLRRFIRYHRNNKAEATLAVHPAEFPSESDLLDCDENGRITAFYPRPHRNGNWYRNLAAASVYILSPAIVQGIPEGPQDFIQHVFPALYPTHTLFAYNTVEYIREMPSPARVEQVARDMESGRFSLASYEHQQKAIFFDRDGVLNLDPGFVKLPDELLLYPFAAEAVRLANQSVYASVVITNQSGIARNMYTEQDLRQVHNKLEWLLGQEGARLDAIYYCPHHPDLTLEGGNPQFCQVCDCRKPKPGMLLKAARAFCIDLRESWMIGDTHRDIEAAKAAGVTPVGVRTGKSLSDTDEKPDFFFDNVLDAVDFIVNNPCEELFIEIYRQYLQHRNERGDRPFVIAIGGNSGSGKSTVAASLRKKFNDIEETALSVHLDHWIKPAHLRNANENVFSRFRLDDLDEDMEALLQGEIISIPKYDMQSRAHKGHILYGLGASRIVIIEGVPALASAVCNAHAHLKIFCDVPEDLYRQRFFARYIWKGFDEQIIQQLFEERKNDERPFIDPLRTRADIIFTLNAENHDRLRRNKQD